MIEAGPSHNRPVITRAALLGGAAALAASAATVNPARAADGTPIRVFSTVQDDLRPFLYAQNSGMFKDANLDVTFQPANTGAIVAQEVIGGAADIGKGSITSIIAAHARKLPFVVVVPGLSYRPDAYTAGYLVAADSPLKNYMQLQGKTVTCSAIGDIAYLGLRALIDKSGGDSSTVKFIEMPFSAVPAALEAGRIDAGLMGEPAMTEGIKAGKLRYLVDELRGYSRPILEVVYFTTREFATANKDELSRFRDVMLKAAAYANSHVGETVDLLSPLIKMDPKVALEMRHGYTATTFDPAAMQPVIDTMVKYKLIDKGFDARELI